MKALAQRCPVSLVLVSVVCLCLETMLPVLIVNQYLETTILVWAAAQKHPALTAVQQALALEKSLGLRQYFVFVLFLPGHLRGSLL